MYWVFMWIHSSKYWTMIHVKKFFSFATVGILGIEVENKMNC